MQASLVSHYCTSSLAGKLILLRKAFKAFYCLLCKGFDAYAGPTMKGFNTSARRIEGMQIRRWQQRDLIPKEISWPNISKHILARSTLPGALSRLTMLDMNRPQLQRESLRHWQGRILGLLSETRQPQAAGILLTQC